MTHRMRTGIADWNPRKSELLAPNADRDFEGQVFRLTLIAELNLPRRQILPGLRTPGLPSTDVIGLHRRLGFIQKKAGASKPRLRFGN